MEVLKAADIKAFLTNMAKLMQEKKDELTELDSVIGDGDLGLTMSKGFAKVAETVGELDEADVGTILMKSGMAMAAAVPSTMGTLMATGLMRGGKAVQGKEEIGLPELAELMQAFVNGIMTRGKAKVGDKTILDSLYPAAEALKTAVKSGKTLAEGVSVAYQEAVAGLEATREMVSQHGKAACFQEKTRGKQDPGATVGMYLLKALAETVQQTSG
ncbi:MAG: dihydroxyacetone kinase subunit L [Firmicutes bacterium]|nr:dihydroxyacetone kinase subunit L [Bacillota bacterium]